MSTLISIVVPAYKESANLPVLVERCAQVAQKLSGEYQLELVIVDDGSPDATWFAIKGLASSDIAVRGLALSRNFGKEIALTAGIHAARGAAVICMDADLQHPPEVIPELIAAWRQGAKVVSTRRRVTKLPLMRRVGSKIYYWLMRNVAGVNLTSQATDFGLYDRSVVDVFNKMTERSRMFRGMIDWLGSEKAFVEFDSAARLHGDAGYSYRKLFTLAVNSLTSFSLFPLKVTGYLGVVTFLLSSALLLVMLLDRCCFNHFVFTTLAFVVVANTMFIGVVLMALGLMALYIGVIHNEVINRPLYVVSDTTEPKA
jgi:polyisoprenyl-phosphate glycosyltransferase